MGNLNHYLAAVSGISMVLICLALIVAAIVNIRNGK